jgi:ABC-type multidrug transport system fused ATPase/permease subunit
MHWHGVSSQSQSPGALEEEEIGKLFDFSVAIRLAGFLSNYWLLGIISAGAVLLYTLASVATPWIIKLGIDTLLQTRDTSALNTILLLFAVAMLSSFIFNYIQLIIMAVVSQKLLLDMRERMFKHLQRLSLSFYDRNEVGRIMSRVQNDVQQLQEFLSIFVLSFADALGLAGIVIAMLLMNVRLALTTFTVIPVLIIMMVIWQKYARISFVRVRKAIAIVNSGLQENISGVRVIQSLSREDINLKRFNQINHAHMSANLHASRLSATLMPGVEILTAIAFAMVVIFGGSMVIASKLEVGVLVAFALYIQRFFDPIRNLTMQYGEFQRAMISGRRIFQILDVEPEIKDNPGAQDLPILKGDIHFDKVSFEYTDGIPVLQKIDLHIGSGETVALVGPTGAGKTSIVSLLARFYDVSSGHIMIDGQDVRDVTRRSLATQIGMVLQEPFLFSGTVADNIRYSCLDATQTDIENAAKAVGAHDFIMRLEYGYATELQERGINLSVGQRQLISFARALVSNPRILILDEATANIDSHTEVLIQRALERLLEGRTSVVIAHRLSTIRNADRIVVINQTRIVEMGNHSELLALDGLYKHLHTLNYPVEPTEDPMISR